MNLSRDLDSVNTLCVEAFPPVFSSSIISINEPLFICRASGQLDKGSTSALHP